MSTDGGRVGRVIDSDAVAAVRWCELERTMRPVFVVVLDVHAQDSLEVSASEDEVRSRQSLRTVRTQRSANAFAFGARTGVRITSIPSVRKTSSKARLNSCRGRGSAARSGAPAGSIA